MKKITIKYLSVQNFKCHKKLSLDFMGGNASIYGDNATGKTSVYDALTWLLFGKDSQGNGEKNIEIKPLDSTGAVADHQAITAVEAVLNVNGEDIRPKRTYQEVWSTKRGSSEPTYDGNTSEYYVDDVPLKKNAFQDKINSIVDEDMFLMLTSVNHFASDLPWRKRREILFDISKVATDAEIMATREQFTELSEAMGKLSLEEYKAKLLAEKRGLVGARNEIPARIDECGKTIDDLSSLDFVRAKEEAGVLQTSIDRLNGELLSLQRNTASDAKNMELREAQLQLEKLDLENRNYRQSQAQAAPNTNGIKADIKIKKDSITRLIARNQILESNIKNFDRRVFACREKWAEINGETFTIGSCPTCKQPLPVDQLRTAQQAFEANKQERLNAVIAEADGAKKTIADLEAELNGNKKYLTECENEVKALEDKLKAAESVVIVVHDMEGYSDTAEGIKAQITSIQGELYRFSQDAYAAGENIRRELAEMKAQLAEKNTIISKESALGYARERIEKLREKAQAGAEKLAEVEKYLYLIEEFSRYKTGFIENSINSLFRIARFRLFREQANGGIEDRCDVVYEGVPYIALNNGAKINVGIDIINALSVAYGVTVPLFVDNAESITRLESSAAQIIRLVVSENDKELRISCEN